MSDGSTGRASGEGQQVQLNAVAPQGLEMFVDSGGLNCNRVVSAVLEVIKPDLTTTQWNAVILGRGIFQVRLLHVYRPGDLDQLGRYVVGCTLTLNDATTVPTTTRPLFVGPVESIENLDP